MMALPGGVIQQLPNAHVCHVVTFGQYDVS
jgi:hypothetical protein